MFRSIFASIQTKFYSLWAFIIRKSKMPEIRLNCLVVPDNIQAEKITRQHLLTINIDTQESVHALRSKIKKECAPCFDDIPITEFVVRVVEFSSNDLGKDNNTALFLSLKNGLWERNYLQFLQLLLLLSVFPNNLLKMIFIL